MCSKYAGVGLLMAEFTCFDDEPVLPCKQSRCSDYCSKWFGDPNGKCINVFLCRCYFWCPPRPNSPYPSPPINHIL